MLFCIVHYNTPKLTTALICSINKFTKNADIIVFENSDKNKLENIFTNVKILDNSAQQLINFDAHIKNFVKTHHITNKILEHEKHSSNFGSYKHALSIQYLYNNLNTDFILLDSDVLLTRDVTSICDTSKAFCGAIRQPNIRVYPFVVYLNTKLLKDNKISICDNVNIYPNYTTNKNDTMRIFFTRSFAKEITIYKHRLY